MLDEPESPVRRGARRREGERQARRDRRAARALRHAAHRRRDGVHVPRRAGRRDRRLARRSRPASTTAGSCSRPGRIAIPTDVVVAARDDVPTPKRGTSARSAIPDGWKGLDIGPETAGALRRRARAARRPCCGTARWACSSWRRSRPARARVAEAVADCRGFTVVGGGDSAAAVRQMDLADRIDHVSTGGGASLELIELGDLPGLAGAARDTARRRDLTRHERPQAADGGQLEDAPHASRSDPGRAEALVPPRRQGLRRTSTSSVCPRVHRAAIGADDDRQRPTSRSRSARRTATGSRRARSPARSARRCSPSCNVQYVIVGHSERRELFGETDEMVAKKLRAVLGAGMTPILCVGETLDEREAGRHRRQGRRPGPGRARRVWPTTDLRRCVVAYEPIWAIGTGRNATPDDANATIAYDPGSSRRAFAERPAPRCGSSTAAA